ncbi:MAG: flippase [Candidatus Andersenbacteria bacterium]
MIARTVMSQSILLNTTVALVGRLVTLVLGLVATALMTRILGAQEFGQYAFVATIGIFLQLIADFGLYLTASRELGHSSGQGNIRFGHILSLRSIFLIAIYSVGGVIMFLMPSLRSYVPLFFVFAIGFAAQSVSQLLLSVFQAYGVVWRATISDIVGRIAQVGVLIALFYQIHTFSSHVIAAAAAFSVGLAITCCIHLLLSPNKKILTPAFSSDVWKTIIKISFPIGALLVLNAIYFRIDTVMLAWLRSPQEVGWYALAYRVIENTLFFPAMLGGLVLPHISASIKNGDTKRSRAFVEQSLFFSLSLALPIVAFLVMFSKQFVVFLSGQSFASSGPILSVLAWAAGIMFVGNILGFVLIALRRQRELLYLYIGLALGNIVANMFFIPTYGALGAAWITVITEGVATSVASYLVYEHIKWRISLRNIVTIIIPVLIALGVGQLLPPGTPFPVAIMLVCAVYGILGYTIGIWSNSKNNLLRSTRGL